MHPLYGIVRRSVKQVRDVDLRVISPGQRNFFRRNATVLASRFQHCVCVTSPRFEPRTFYSRNVTA